MPTATVRSVCPHDCPDTCGLLVTRQSERVLAVRGDPDHPFTRGVICPKVAEYPRRVHAPSRLTRPLRRVGPKGGGEFKPISWEAALEEIEARLRAVIAEHGPQAILPYSYAGTMGMVHRFAGHAFFHKLGASRLKRTICSSMAMAGFAASLGPMPSAALEGAAKADMVIIWGSNTLSTNLHAWRFFAQARKRGARIVVVDPYRNQTARKADLHLAIRPGTDAALALGMMHVLIAEDLLDRDYIARWTLGFEALRERARIYTPDKVSDVTGIPAEAITDLARQYGRAWAPFIRLGYGTSRQLRGGMAVRSISLLPALTGAFRKPPGGLTFSTSLADQLRMEVWERPDLAPAASRWINMVALGDALSEKTSPPVKALLVYLSNPAVVAPDSRRVLAGLARKDLFVAVLEQFLTDTALFADIVLPGTTFLEHTDFYCSYGHYYVQMSRPAIPVPGQCRSPHRVFQDLARRFGFTEPCFAWDEEEVIRHILPEDAQAFEGVSFEALSRGRPVRLHVPDNPFEKGFATPSGKVEFYAERLARRGLDPLPEGTPSEDPEGEGRYPLHLITPPRRHFLNSTFNEVEVLRRRAGEPTLKIHPDDARVRGIRGDTLVRAFNDRGECRLYAEVTEDTPPGVTVAEGLYWPQLMPGGKGINQLTSQRLGDMGESCAFHCNLVEVEPCPAVSRG